MAGAWLSLHLWEHYAFGGDLAWLRDTGYPLMKGAAEFDLDWLVEGPDGHLVTAPSTSPENLYKTPEGYVGSVSVMTTGDLALIRGLFLNVIQASETLGIDADFRARVKAALDRLPPYKVGRRGNLQEWYDDWDDNGPAAPPRLAPLRALPGRSDQSASTRRTWRPPCGARSSSAATAARAGARRGRSASGRGSRRRPRLPDAAEAPALVVGDGRDGYSGRRHLSEPVRRAPAVPDRRQLRRHGRDRRDAAAEPAGEIHLLPALPSAWPTGSVRGLRARGGFTVEERWKDGRLVGATIRADRDGVARIRYREATAEQVVKAGRAVTVTARPGGLVIQQ